MSTFKRIFAIAFIFIFATIAWVILGATIFARTYGIDENLRSKVGSTWGTAQTQAPPTASYQRSKWEKQEVTTGTKTTIKTVETKEDVFLPLDSTRANVALYLEHRLKGLLWYSTYKVQFQADYGFHNTSAKDEDVTFSLPLPAEQAAYDGLTFTINGSPAVTKNQGNSIQATVHLAPGESVKLGTSYKSQGLDQWRYPFSNEVSQVRDFRLPMTTNFQDIYFPVSTISHC